MLEKKGKDSLGSLILAATMPMTGNLAVVDGNFPTTVTVAR